MHQKTQYILCPSAPGTAHHAEQRFAWPQRRRQARVPCMPQLCTFASRQDLFPPAAGVLLPWRSDPSSVNFFSFLKGACPVACRELSHTCRKKMRAPFGIFVLSSGLALLSSPAAAFSCSSLVLRPSYGSPAAATACRSPMRVATSLQMQASTKKKWRGPGNPEAMPPTLI